MAPDDRVKALMAAFQKTPYFQWMERQGIPVVSGYGLEDWRDVELARWPKMGCRAAVINLYGMEGVTGMYVSEVPAGDALEPANHSYSEVISILNGHAASEVWQ